MTAFERQAPGFSPGSERSVRHGLLLLDVLAQDADGRASTRCCKVAGRPENATALEPWVLVKQNALRYSTRMQEKQLINARVTVDEALILSSYAEMTGKSQTEIIRQAIRALEPRLKRVDPKTFDPLLLPSLPIKMTSKLPPLAVVYFFVSEMGSVLYVGESANLSTRCGGHPRHQEALVIDEHSRIHWIERRAGRTAFEAACIARFQPVLNVRGRVTL